MSKCTIHCWMACLSSPCQQHCHESCLAVTCTCQAIHWHEGRTTFSMGRVDVANSRAPWSSRPLFLKRVLRRRVPVPWCTWCAVVLRFAWLKRYAPRPFCNRTSFRQIQASFEVRKSFEAYRRRRIATKHIGLNLFLCGCVYRCLH